MSDPEYVEVRLSLTKETYQALWSMANAVIATTPDGSIEHRAASSLRGAIDTQTGHSKDFEE